MVPGGGKYPTTPPWKLGLKPQNHPFRQIFYISIIASLEPKLFVFQSSTQQQSCKANKIGQFCHQNQCSICLGSKVRDHTMTALLLAPKWQKAANGGFGKFGSFQPYLTHRQLDWATMMFNETPFLGYPTCQLFAHVVWWWTALWTARTTRRRRPGRSLAVGCITSVEIFIN